LYLVIVKNSKTRMTHLEYDNLAKLISINLKINLVVVGLSILSTSYNYFFTFTLDITLTVECSNLKQTFG
jgi:hypothetical protein